MLQIVRLVLLLVAASPGLAQDGVVTSLQRPGGVPTYLLDRLNALETQYNTLNSTLSSYTTTVVTNPASCGASQVFAGTCQAMPTGRNLVEVARTTTASTGDLTAYGATASTSMITRVHGFFNNASGCPTASGWSFCTVDQLKQAQALRITGYNPAMQYLSYFFTFEPGHMGWIASANFRADATKTTSCYGMSSAVGDFDIVRPMMGFINKARYFFYYNNASCSTNATLFCCRTQ